MKEDVSSLYVEIDGTEELAVGFDNECEYGGIIRRPMSFYELNPEFKRKFSSVQEAAQFLVEAIRFWREKCKFLHDETFGAIGEKGARTLVVCPEDEWSFSYVTPSERHSSKRWQKILDRIFGDYRKFLALPFVTCSEYRFYYFRFNLLKHFAENGHDSTVRLVEKYRQEEVRKKAEAEAEKQHKLREEQCCKLTERLGETVVSEELRRQIVPYADNKSLIIVSPNVAAVLTSRSEYGSSGGCGYYDQVRVFCGSQASMQEWQWRDRYSASKDRPSLRVDAMGALKVFEKDNKVSVEVELVNSQHGNRTATYAFDLPKPTAICELSMDEQATFTVQAEKEVARIMVELNQVCAGKEMVNPDPTLTNACYVPYRQPSIKQRELRAEIGIFAFVVEEQIDHRVRDAQMRHALYVLTAESGKAERKAEDHGYGCDGGAFLTILQIGRGCIVINTKTGKVSVELAWE